MIVDVLPVESYMRFQRRLKANASGGVEFTHIARIKYPGVGPITSYVKMYQDTLNNKSRGLINEVIGYIVAHSLNLPQPQRGFVALIPIKELSDAPDWVKNFEIYPAWCTEEVKGAHPPTVTFDVTKVMGKSKLKKDISGWSSFPAVLAFDEWIANMDRHVKNLLRLGKSDYCLIDHGRLVVQDGNWDSHALKAYQIYANRLLSIVCGNAPTLPVKSRMVQSSEKFQHAYNLVAAELADWAKQFLTAPDQQAILAFLANRASNCQQLIKDRYGLVV